jgi:DNA-binding PadR family transcriptional regulator
MWRNNWGFDPSQFWGSGPGPFGRGPFGRGGHGRGGRVFDQGNLKYVVLQLLAEKPRHGYEVIKAIEERFGGTYSPSPGTVYPTLAMLEDMGYAKVTLEEGGKKVYEITDEGRAHLAENKPVVDDIFAKISEFAQNIFGEPMMQVHRAFKHVGQAVYVRDQRRTPEQIQKVAEILERTAQELRDIG